MTFTKDERLLQLEIDRAILYGESCMLEYDMQMLKLQENGLLTESGAESLQYLLEAAASETGFGGVIAKIKNIFAEFLKKFKDKGEQQKFSGNINKLNTMLSAGAIDIDSAIELCMTPDEIEELAKSVNATIQKIQPKIDNGTASDAEVTMLNEAIKTLNDLIAKSGITLGEDDAETTKVAKAFVQRGYNGIVGRAQNVSQYITKVLDRVNEDGQKFLSDLGVSTTKTEKGGKIIDKNGNAVKNRGAKVEVNRSGADIGKDLASKVTGTGEVLNATQLKQKEKERDAAKTEYDNAKANYERLSNNGHNTGSGVDAAKQKMDAAKKKWDDLVKLIENNSKSITAKAESNIEDEIKANGKNASAANINEYREAHKQFLRYLEIYSMLEGKYALECDKALQAMTDKERKDAVDTYVNNSLASIDARIKDQQNALKKASPGSKEYVAIQKEIEDLTTQRKRAELKLKGDDASTKSKLDAERENLAKAKARSDESEKDLELSNQNINTTADNRAKRDKSVHGQIEDSAKTLFAKLKRKVFGDPDKKFIKDRTKYWMDRQELSEADAKAKAEEELRELKEKEA